jgi:hypothetical protein
MAAAPPPPAAPPAPAPTTGGGLSDADVAQLQQLAKLREQGILTDEEFDQQKKLILGG